MKLPFSGRLQKAVSKVAAPNVNESLEKTSEFKRELQVRDRVISTLTNLRGTIVGVGTINGREVVTVRLTNGRLVSQAARQEWRLDSWILTGNLLPRSAGGNSVDYAPALASSVEYVEEDLLSQII